MKATCISVCDRTWKEPDMTYINVLSRLRKPLKILAKATGSPGENETGYLLNTQTEILTAQL
jgi:hypothetical protein